MTRTGRRPELARRQAIGADGARLLVARAEVPGGDRIPYVMACHKIIDAFVASGQHDPRRCDVLFDGRISPDFYGWAFPHGASASVGMTSTCRA